MLYTKLTKVHVHLLVLENWYMYMYMYVTGCPDSIKFSYLKNVIVYMVLPVLSVAYCNIVAIGPPPKYMYVWLKNIFSFGDLISVYISFSWFSSPTPQGFP